MGAGCAHLAHLATHGGLLLLPLGPVLVALLELRRRFHLLDHAHLVRVRVRVRVTVRVRVRAHPLLEGFPRVQRRLAPAAGAAAGVGWGEPAPVLIIPAVLAALLGLG